MALISITTPLAADATWVSEAENLSRATSITGSVVADASGTLYVEQSGDGVNFDLVETYVVDGVGVGVAIQVTVALQWFRIRYVNDGSQQGVFRVFVDLRDEWGNFFPASQPSPGGAWMVLYYNPGRQAYEVVDRFDGVVGQTANGSAALFRNKNGKYAAFLIESAVVTEETLQTTTGHASAAF